MTQTVTVTQASIADLIEQRDELLELMHWAITAVDRLAEVTPSGLLRSGIRAKADEIRAAIAKASPIAGLTEIGGCDE